RKRDGMLSALHLAMHRPEQQVSVTPETSSMFSSRRRHTRCYRDWSSDVCSSDLTVEKGQAAGVHQIARGLSKDGKELVHLELQRSEERRVGKESRSRWSKKT